MQKKKISNKREDTVIKSVGLNIKLVGVIIPVIIAVISLILYLVFVNSSKIILSKSEENLEQSTVSVVNSVSAWMNKVLSSLAAERDALEYFALDKNAELAYIKHTANQNEAYPAGIYIGNIDGSLEHASFIPGPDYNIFEKDWYNDGIEADEFIFGSVYYNEDAQEYSVGASGVLKDPYGNIRGVAAADIYLDAISTIVADIQLEKTGGVFLVDKLTNMIIGHKDSSLVGITLAEQEDPMYQSVSDYISSGASGLVTYRNPDGIELYLDLQPVPNSQWIAVAYVPRQEIMAGLTELMYTTIVLAVISIVVLLILIVIVLWRIVIRPVRKIDIVAQHIADGQLNESIDYRSKDELGLLAANFNKTVERLRNYTNYIAEISSVLEKISAGNLDFELTYDYTGEFARIKNALEHLSHSLNETLGKINQSAGQVSNSAQQVSNNAQSLSQGATEQASSIEELAATITEISEHVKINADNALQANDKVDVVEKEISESNARMQGMLMAMREIGESSSKIGKIIKTIEDIAFQTNILALNAAVEAARAGTAGKGFAVVADEVRNLANKSQEASQNTAELIADSLHATEKGLKIADETADALQTVVEGVQNVTDIIEKISTASEEQAQSISQVTLGMEQISAVVQTNTATAEESAIASEDLSAQAGIMKDLVGHFHLKIKGN